MPTIEEKRKRGSLGNPPLKGMEIDADLSSYIRSFLEVYRP